MGRDQSKRKKASENRDSGGFVAIPWSVLDCPAWQALSHTSRDLLLELARQFVRDNNGQLVCCDKRLGPRGWRSPDVISRAKRQLIDLGFIFETRKGHRPNKASWYAITWYALDWHTGYDAGVLAAFERSAYKGARPGKIESLNTAAVAIKPR